MPSDIFLDSFDHYGSSDIPQKYQSIAGSPLVGAQYARTSAQGVRLDSGVTLERTVPLAGTVFCGQARNTSDLSGTIFQLNNIEANKRTPKLSLIQMGDGRLYFNYTDHIYLDPPVGVVLPSGDSPPSVEFPIGNNRWHYIEIKSTITSSKCYYECRVDEHLILPAPGDKGYIDTSEQAILEGQGLVKAFYVPWASMTIGGPGGGNHCLIDDVYENDLMYLGDIVIGVIHPNGIGDLTQDIPTPTTDNWNNTKDIIFDGDATYVTAVNQNDEDLYQMEDIPNNAEVLAIQTVLGAKKDAGGICAISHQLKLAGSERQGSVFFPPAVNYVFSLEGHVINPFTGVPFTAAEINAIQFGVKKTQ